MKTYRSILIVALAAIAGACATDPPIQVAVDRGAPAVAEADGLRAELRVLPPEETGQIFGYRTSLRFGVVELRLANRSPLPVALERKQIRVVSPAGKATEPLTSRRVAFLAGGSPSGCGADNAVCMLALLITLGTQAESHKRAQTWEPFMPETLKVAAGEERLMLLVFDAPNWTPGAWRLELPTAGQGGAAGPRLSVPLTFAAVPRPAN